MLLFTQQKCVVVNFAFDEPGARLLPREGHSFLGIGNCSINVFERTDAPTAFVVFGALELSLRRTQVLEGSPHVRLIGPNRIQTSGCNYGNDSETDSQYCHPARSKQSPHQVELRGLSQSLCVEHLHDASITDTVSQPRESKRCVRGRECLLLALHVSGVIIQGVQAIGDLLE